MVKLKKISAVIIAVLLIISALPSFASFADNNANPFSDVNQNEWYYDAVQYVNSRGLMTGTGGGKFSPAETTTRGMVVTVLHRLENSPVSSTNCKFTDIDSGAYYATAVSWASSNGIVTGYNDKAFGPNDSITREQMATILYRYSAYKKYDVTKTADLSKYSDSSSISDFAKVAMSWANATGLITGTTTTTLSPLGNAVRAQFATVLNRFCEKVAEKSFTVVFDLNYNNAGTYKLQQVKADGMAIMPGNPTRSGYTFDGWYKSKSGDDKYDFTAKVTAGFTLYAHWSEVKGGSSSSGGGGGGSSETDPSNPEISLSANKTEFFLGEDGTVYFYAETNCDVEYVKLIDTETKNVLLTLVDDGHYSESGDDLPGDNIFSAKSVIDTSYENSYKFAVIISDKSDIVSNTVEILVFSEFTGQQLSDMESVENEFQTELFENQDFYSLNIDERKTISDNLLGELQDADLIQEDSAYYDNETETYTFVYSTGVLGTLVIGNCNSKQNGLGALNEYNSKITNNLLNATPQNDVTVGKALVLWSFNQAWDDENYRRPFYEQLEKDFEDAGLETTVNYSTTINDYKNISGYDVIVFSGHGSYDTYKAGVLGTSKTTVSSLLLHEKATLSKDSTYAADLKSFRVGKANVSGGAMYTILPNFFTHYYSSGDLDNSFVFAENCEFYGKDGNVDNTMASSITTVSAESVIGFHNSVMADYSRELMKEYILNLTKGYTTEEAFNLAKEKYGDNDYFTGRESYGPTAYPLFLGDSQSLLIYEDLKNGNFEMAGTPVKWSRIGDVRVINKLESILPTKNSRMAILTTGIGSAEQEYLSGTEGSVLGQTVKIPSNKNTLSFYYDFVSEEPMEYFNSKFNDTFKVQIVSEYGTETVYCNDVNSATWIKIDGINFDGGDDTTYHTIWTNVSCDISKYSGKTVNILFTVCDVGDSIYDSAVLLDDICLK